MLFEFILGNGRRESLDEYPRGLHAGHSESYSVLLKIIAMDSIWKRLLGLSREND
jgi:hypothetical protein